MDEGEFAGQSVVVAGASRGIGLAATRMFAAAGAEVHALARDRDALTTAIGPEGTGSGAVIPHAVDATDPVSLRTVFEEVLARADVDVVLSTVGANIHARRLDELDAAAWAAMVRANLDSAFYLIQSSLASLRRTRGLFIAIGSASAVWPNMSGAAYQASKLGLYGLTRAAAREEHERGVRFTVISPGLVHTEHLAQRPTPPSPDALEQSLRPDDVARACCFVAALPARVHVPEMVMLPCALQSPGQTEIPAAPA